MRAGRYDININQGADYTATVTLRQPVLNSDGTVKRNADGTPDRSGDPVILRGYTFRGEIRTVPGGTLVDAFVISPISETDGTLQLALTAAQTKAYTDTEYVYDIEATIGTVVRRILQGHITVDPEVTQDEVPGDTQPAGV